MELGVRGNVLLRETEGLCQLGHAFRDVMVLEHADEVVDFLYQAFILIRGAEETPAFKEVAVHEEALLLHWLA